MKPMARYILAVLLFHGSIIPSNGAAAQETWALMGRHGGCHSFAEAAARKPIFEGVVVPDDLTAKLRAQGIKFERRDLKVHDQTVVTVSAPELGLDLLLAPVSLCQR